MIIIGETTKIVCGGKGNHKCNEDLIFFDTSGDRVTFTDQKKAQDWYSENGEKVRSGGVACSICGRAAIEDWI